MVYVHEGERLFHYCFHRTCTLQHVKATSKFLLHLILQSTGYLDHGDSTLSHGAQTLFYLHHRPPCVLPVPELSLRNRPTWVLRGAKQDADEIGYTQPRSSLPSAVRKLRCGLFNSQRLVRKSSIARGSVMTIYTSKSHCPLYRYFPEGLHCYITNTPAHV